jgi:uncharacterized protein YfkK (UPF0435 family)
MQITESTRVQMLKDMWHEAIEGQAEYVQQAITNYGFYLGGEKQWDPEDIAILDRFKRHHLSLNIIFPIINLLTGYERQNRMDIKCFPKKGGIHLVAQLLTELCKHVEDMSNADYLRSTAFLDGIIAIKGFLSLDISYEEDPFNGEITIENDDPFDITEDPNNKKYDMNAGKYVIKSYWGDKEQIKLIYPKSKDNIDDLKYDDLDTRDRERLPGSDKSPDKFKARIRETWWKHYEKATYLINTYTNDVKRVNKTKIDLLKYILEKDRRMTEQQGINPIYAVRDNIIPVLNCTTTIGDIELEHVERPLGEMTKFPIIRFIPYFIQGNILGAVDNLIDAQREKNKRRSQALNIINSSVNSGFYNQIEGGADPDELAEQAKLPAPIINYKTVQPKKIEPTQISTGHVALEQLAEEDATKISSVNANMLAQGAASESGVKDRQRINQGLIGNEIIFDNMKYSHQIYAETIIDMIRYSHTFSTAEMMAIASEEKMEANVDQLLEAIRSRQVGKYGIKVSESSSNPTIRYANFEMLLDMAKLYGPEIIPPDIVLEASDMAKKEDLIERLKQQQAMQAQLAQQQLRQTQAQQKGQTQTQKKQLVKR